MAPDFEFGHLGGVGGAVGVDLEPYVAGIYGCECHGDCTYSVISRGYYCREVGVVGTAENFYVFGSRSPVQFHDNFADQFHGRQVNGKC